MFKQIDSKCVGTVMRLAFKRTSNNMLTTSRKNLIAIFRQGVPLISYHHDSNKNKNHRIRQITKGFDVSGENWLELSKNLEKVAVNRTFQLQNHTDWKKKNKLR